MANLFGSADFKLISVIWETIHISNVKPFEIINHLFEEDYYYK
jgi:hypothetical protein